MQYLSFFYLLSMYSHNALIFYELLSIFLFSDGLKFFRSANDVILCPGNEDGAIPVGYFLKVVDKRSGK